MLETNLRASVHFVTDGCRMVVNEPDAALSLGNGELKSVWF